MRVRAIAVTASLGCLGACTDGAPASCYLEDVIDRRIGLTYVDDCGAVGPDDPEAAFTAAHVSESLCLDCADAVRVSVCVTNPADQP